MIISPAAFQTVNVLHGVHNAFKCTDEVYMFSQSEEDCHLYVQKSYWGRDPRDDFVAPNFVEYRDNLFIIRPDLVGYPKDSMWEGDIISTDTSSQSGSGDSGWWGSGDGVIDLGRRGYGGPLVAFDREGYRFGAGLDPVPVRVGQYRMVLPPNNLGPLPAFRHESQTVSSQGLLWWFLMTQSYFLPQSLRLMKCPDPAVDCTYQRWIPNTQTWFPNRFMPYHAAPNFSNIKSCGLSWMDAIAPSIKFGDERVVHAILLYRPHEGVLPGTTYTCWSWGSWTVHWMPETWPGNTPDGGRDEEFKNIQLLGAPEYSERYNVLFDLSERRYRGPDKADQRLIVGGTEAEFGGSYIGGTPEIIRLQYPLSLRELYLRWTGSLSHFQLIDSPLLEISDWYLSEFPENKYRWQREEAREIARNPANLLQEGRCYGVDCDEEDHLEAAANFDPFAELGLMDFEYTGDFERGITFAHPCDRARWSEYSYAQNRFERPEVKDGNPTGNVEFTYTPSRLNPYAGVDYYAAKCEQWVTASESERATTGDVWSFLNLLEGYFVRVHNGWSWGSEEYRLKGRPICPYDAANADLFPTRVLINWWQTLPFEDVYGAWDANAYDDCLAHTSEMVHDRMRTVHIRDVSDNRLYEMNKALLKWYYNYEDNSWKTNATRHSTSDQLRFIVELRAPREVIGVINPMSNPATFNRPTFFGEQSRMYDTQKTGLRTSNFLIHPGLFEHYNAPYKVLLESKLTDSPQEQWALMDEYTLDLFSTRAHTYLSYPRRAKYIRITIQEWYNTAALLSDLKKSYFQTQNKFSRGYGGTLFESHNQCSPSDWSETTPVDHGRVNPLAGRDLGEYTSAFGRSTITGGEEWTIGRLLDNPPDWSDTTNHLPDIKNIDMPNFLEGAREEYERWERLTLPSLWKAIYIPPFIFFGDNNMPRR